MGALCVARGTVAFVADLTLRLRNFRALDSFEWSPSGVVLLAGANGAGKTTVLDALLFLRLLFQRGHVTALGQVRAEFFRTENVPEEDPVVFEVEVGDLLWRLELPMSNVGMQGHYGEEVLRGGKSVLRARRFEQKWELQGEQLELDEVRCCAKVAWDRGGSPWMKPLVDALSSIQVYKGFNLYRVRSPVSREPYDRYLAWHGDNLRLVLKRWKGAHRQAQGRFEWVLERMREAFPGLCDDLELEDSTIRMFSRGSAAGFPIDRVADGVLTGLLQLVAVAGMERGGFIAFDELETHLHPHAIRSISRALRERAEEMELTVALTTHSPVVMNEFLDEWGQVYVLQRSGDRAMPTALTDLHSEEWLAQSKLGSLYERLAFASPPGV